MIPLWPPPIPRLVSVRFLDYLLTLLRIQEDLNVVISRLEKLEVIEENLIKYWKRDKVYCRLNIINSDLTIKVQDFKYINWK